LSGAAVVKQTNQSKNPGPEVVLPEQPHAIMPSPSSVPADSSSIKHATIQRPVGLISSDQSAERWNAWQNEQQTKNGPWDSTTSVPNVETPPELLQTVRKRTVPNPPAVPVQDPSLPAHQPRSAPHLLSEQAHRVQRLPFQEPYQLRPDQMPYPAPITAPIFPTTPINFNTNIPAHDHNKAITEGLAINLLQGTTLQGQSAVN